MRSRSFPAPLAVLVCIAISAALPAAAGAKAGGTILFQGGTSTVAQIFSINPDGTALQQLTHAGGEGAENPAWSPDGTTFAFDVGQEERADIFIARADGSHVVRLTIDASKFHGDPAFSPDGKQISFDEDSGDGQPTVHGIFVANVDGTGSHRLTTALTGKDAYDTESQWSPDGASIAFTRVKSSKEAAIFTVKADGTGLSQLTPYALDAASPHWSPDGSKIAFNTYWDPHPGKSANVYTITPDGKDMTALTHNRGGKMHSFRPAWSPDGTKIVIAQFVPKGKAGRLDLYVINPDGTGARRVTSKKVVFAAAGDWGPARPSSAPSASGTRTSPSTS